MCKIDKFIKSGHASGDSRYTTGVHSISFHGGAVEEVALTLWASKTGSVASTTARDGCGVVLFGRGDAGAAVRPPTVPR